MLPEEAYKDEKLFQRRGTFAVTEEMLREHPFALQQVMSEVIITDSIYNFNNKRFEYWGISPHFNVIPDNQMAPPYRPMMDTITKDDDPDFLEHKVKFDKE